MRQIERDLGPVRRRCHPLAMEFIRRMDEEGLDFYQAREVLDSVQDLLDYTKISADAIEMAAERHNKRMTRAIREAMKNRGSIG